MEKNTKVLMLLSCVLVSFIFAVTSPFIQIHFFKLVPVKIYTVSQILAVALAAITNGAAANIKVKEIFRRWFTMILLVDSIMFVVISFMGVEFITIRFLGMAILNAVSSNLWIIIMKDSVNQLINGDQLTAWDAVYNSASLIANLAGLVVSLIIPNMSLETGIAIQCIGYCIFAVSDYISFNRMKNQIASKENEV